MRLLTTNCALQRTAGAKHVIQRVLLGTPRVKQPEPLQESERTREIDDIKLPSGAGLLSAGAGLGIEFDDMILLDKEEVMQDIHEFTKQQLDVDQGVLFIEYMPRGRLSDYIGKVAIKKSHFPDEVLWQVFDCCKCSKTKKVDERSSYMLQCSARSSAWRILMPSSLLIPTQRPRTSRWLMRGVKDWSPRQNTTIQLSTLTLTP